MFLLGILDQKKGFIINSIEPIHKYYSQLVLSKLFLFEKQYQNGILKDYIHNRFNTFVNPIDGEKLAYFLQVPIKTRSLYPIVFYFSFDDSSTRIPTAPNRVFSENPDNIQHVGSNPNYSTMLTMQPEEGLRICILTNINSNATCYLANNNIKYYTRKRDC